MTRKEDLITLGQREIPWRDVPSDQRISLKAVELAFVALNSFKSFSRVMIGRGIDPETFLAGVCSLDMLDQRLSDLFNGSLTDKGREKVGQHILNVTGVTQSSIDDLKGSGDSFAVKQLVSNWVRTSFGVELSGQKR